MSTDPGFLALGLNWASVDLLWGYSVPESILSTWSSWQVGATPVMLVPVPNSLANYKSGEGLREDDIIVLRTHGLTTSTGYSRIPGYAPCRTEDQGRRPKPFLCPGPRSGGHCSRFYLQSCQYVFPGKSQEAGARSHGHWSPTAPLK